jgi:hypothetical protein
LVNEVVVCTIEDLIGFPEIATCRCRLKEVPVRPLIQQETSTFHAYLSNVSARKAARLVFPDKLSVKGNRHLNERRRPAKIQTSQLIAGLVFEANSAASTVVFAEQ